MAFSNAERSWEETADLVKLLAGSLTSLSHKFEVRGEWIELRSGFLLVPQIVHIVPSDDGKAIRTASTIQVSHPQWVPNGVFEYQHSWGPDTQQSFASGFTQWAQMDLPVYLYAAGEKGDACSSMVIKPGREDSSIFPPNRRVILGPTGHLVNQPATEAEEHAFCSCCLFTNSIDAFKDLLRQEDFLGIRLFAWRSANGETIEADCRVNGVDFPSATEGLRRYASSWPRRGLEFRKQYVAMQTLPGTTTA